MAGAGRGSAAPVVWDFCLASAVIGSSSLRLRSLVDPRVIMADMKKAVVYIPMHRQADRAAKMRALLCRLSPHGGNAAKQVKQTRPRGRKG